MNALRLGPSCRVRGGPGLKAELTHGFRAASWGREAGERVSGFAERVSVRCYESY